MAELICINVKGGKRVPIVVRARGEKAVFATPVEELDQIKVITILITLLLP